MTTAAELQQKQIEQAEELFFSGPQREGFAKDLFFGRFRTESIMPWPELSDEEKAGGDEAVAAVDKFCREVIDPDRIDRQADIPPEVIRGLGELGVLGMTIAPEYGGKGLSQQNYCRVMEVIGGRCASTAVFVNAHHSIGLRALELFGTEEQKDRWLRPLATGEQLAAFALTEPEAGSDAANVQTRAEPTEDGKGYILNGEKRYITNAAVAQVLTVMARVAPRSPAILESRAADRPHSSAAARLPGSSRAAPSSAEEKGGITAFLVTPDMPGFEVVEPRMEKCGIRGTATGRLAFHNMYVPRENVLGTIGKGLRVALTVLDFGRTTFGASCTGAAKFCLEQMIERANSRRQFGRTLGEFELVKEKVAQAAADIFAMESATYYTAALIDSGAEDYMLETAMLKVFASDALWRIVNDTLQVWGGAGYFTDQPFERMMRDARINLIGEGANDVLRCFIAMVGLRNVGMDLQQLRKKPWRAAKLWRPRPQIPVVPPVGHQLVLYDRMQSAAADLSRQIKQFERACRGALIRYREGILERQYVQARLGDAATELFLSGCVYSRLSALISRAEGDGTLPARDLQAGLLYLKSAHRRNARRLAELKSNDDELQTIAADAWLSE